MSSDPKPLRQTSVNIRVSQETAAAVPSFGTSRGSTTVRKSIDAHMDRIACDEYAKLVQRVFLHPASDAPHVVVFSGIDPGNGCTRVCRNVAEILAGSSSGTVCLVDAGFYCLPLPRNSAERKAPGVSESLTGEPIRTYVHQMNTDNLWLLSRGTPTSSSSHLIALDAARRGLEELRQEFDRVVIDAPPLNVHSDAVSLAQLADGLIVVIEADVTRRATAREAMETARQAGVKILGAVLNKRSFPIPEKLYRQL